jgi:hypothetical protein
MRDGVGEHGQSGSVKGKVALNLRKVTDLAASFRTAFADKK